MCVKWSSFLGQSPWCLLLKLTCSSSPSIFAMAGEASWKSEKRFERNSDIFSNQTDFTTNERFRQSESHLTNDDNYDDVRRAAFTTTSTSSRRSSTESKSQSKESSPRKGPSRSRDSSQSKMLTDYKFQLLNQDRRPSQEITLNSSGRRSLKSSFELCLKSKPFL